MDKTFKYALGQRVIITVSGEEGEVIGRADYLESENGYLVRFKDATGHAREAWWSQSAFRFKDATGHAREAWWSQSALS